jgi:regulator of sigma E protease
MIESVFHVLLAILGLGVLIVIHELGHYWVAKKKGMKIEIFSVGFGKPLFSWKFQGVKWQIAMFPFGGYVKIAGMQKEGSREPYEIPNGFFAKKPIDRIQVAFMGPFVNFLFAFLAFSALWFFGGREKSFSEFTHKIGSIDPQSSLYQKGIRPGDEISSYAKQPFHGAQDLLIASILEKKEVQIQGEHIQYLQNKKTPFDYTLSAYPKSKDFYTIGIEGLASYLFVAKEAFYVSDLMEKSGVKSGDRVVWADGNLLFSRSQLQALMNRSVVFVTVQRGNVIFPAILPRVKLSEFTLSSQDKEEIDDWFHEAQKLRQGSNKAKVSDVYFIPYGLNADCVVEKKFSWVDPSMVDRLFLQSIPLEKGDRILTVSGKEVNKSSSFLQEIQERKVLFIVQRDVDRSVVSWKDADKQFDESLRVKDLEIFLKSLLENPYLQSYKGFILLPAVEPKTLSSLIDAGKVNKDVLEWIEFKKNKVLGLKDSEQREKALQALESESKQMVLGVHFEDQRVSYNPNPFVLFYETLEGSVKTLTSLVSGAVNPKWLSGPIGIVTVMQKSWGLGAKEGLYWLGMISLYLGFFNLLPIPVLDGGHIVFSVVEMFTKKPIKSKTMDRWMIPFVVLMVLFFLYVTYQDLSRIFGRFFSF